MAAAATSNWHSIDDGKYEFVVLPGNLTSNRELVSYHKKSYSHWKKIWQRVFRHIEGDEAFNPDDFLKHTNIFGIYHNGEVVSQICSRVLYVDDDLTLDIPYFREIATPVFSDLARTNVKKIMTLEFNALNPLYSKRRTGFPFADALLFLCFEGARSLGVECCTAVPRKITRVQETLREMGFKTLLENLVRFNCPIDVMLGYVCHLSPAKEPGLADFVRALWEKRTDHNLLDSFRHGNMATVTPPPQKDIQIN